MRYYLWNQHFQEWHTWRTSKTFIWLILRDKYAMTTWTIRNNFFPENEVKKEQQAVTSLCSMPDCTVIIFGSFLKTNKVETKIGDCDDLAQQSDDIFGLVWQPYQWNKEVYSLHCYHLHYMMFKRLFSSSSPWHHIANCYNKYKVVCFAQYDTRCRIV